jgi:hypothetical protein
MCLGWLYDADGWVPTCAPPPARHTHPQIVPEKQCAFVGFLYPNDAMTFYNGMMAYPPNVHGRVLRVGWGKPTPVPADVAMAVARGASRKVYIGGVRSAPFPALDRVTFCFCCCCH